MQGKGYFIDGYGIFHSAHPCEDGVIFDRNKFMAGIAAMEKKRLAKRAGLSL